MNLTIYCTKSVASEEFVDYWSVLYPEKDKKKDIEFYQPNIGRRSPEALYELFRWKSGEWLKQKWQKAVEEKIIPRLAELKTLSEDSKAEDFLHRFSEGGAVFRIFLLHCWFPNRFPIYDQHVHRAMSMAKTGRCEEIENWPEEKKITSYLKNYLAFYSTFVAFDPRSVDRALWTFGKFIKTSRLPGGCKASTLTACA